MPEARKTCVFFLIEKKNIPEIISSVRKFPLILTSNVKSRMKSLPSAGQGPGDFSVNSGFLGFRSAKGMTYLYSGPA